MSYLFNGALAKLQGVPVENRHDEQHESIEDAHLISSPASSLSSSSSLQRFLKVTNGPLLLANKSATSIHADNEGLSNSNTFPSILSQRKSPYRVKPLSFLTFRDQSTSNEVPTPQDKPLPIAKSTTLKWSIPFYWNRLFHRQKNRSKVEAPEQETLAGKEVEAQKQKQQQSHLDLETQSAKDVGEPSLGASQEQQLPVDPKPEVLEPIEPERLLVPNESEVYRLKWLFNRLKRQNKDDVIEKVVVQKLQPKENNQESASKIEEPRLGASQEQLLPSNPEPDHLKPKTPMPALRATESEVYWKRWFYRRKSQAKVEAPKPKTGNETEEEPVLKLQQKQNTLETLTQPLSDVEEPSLDASQEQQTPTKSDDITVAAESENAKPHQPSPDEVDLPIDPEPQRLRPKTQEQELVKNVSDEQDHLPVAVKSADAAPKQQNSDATEPEDVKPHQSVPDEVNLPIDKEPERLEPKSQEQRLTRNVSDEQDHLPVAVKSAKAASNELTSDATEPEDAKPQQPSSDEVDLSSTPETERWRPKTKEKRLAKNVSEGQCITTFKHDHLSVAAEPEDVATHESAFDTDEQEDAESHQPASD